MRKIDMPQNSHIQRAGIAEIALPIDREGNRVPEDSPNIYTYLDHEFAPVVRAKVLCSDRAWRNARSIRPEGQTLDSFKCSISLMIYTVSKTIRGTVKISNGVLPIFTAAPEGKNAGILPVWDRELVGWVEKEETS